MQKRPAGKTKKEKAKKKRVVIEFLAFTAALVATIYLLPARPVNEQVSLGSALDLVVAFALRHI